MKRLLITLAVLLSCVVAYYAWALPVKEPVVTPVCVANPVTPNCDPREIDLSEKSCHGMVTFVNGRFMPEEEITVDCELVNIEGFEYWLREIKFNPDWANDLLKASENMANVQALGKTPKIEGVEFSLRENKLDLPNLINVGPAITVPLFIPATTPVD